LWIHQRREPGDDCCVALRDRPRPKALLDPADAPIPQAASNISDCRIICVLSKVLIALQAMRAEARTFAETG